MSLSKQYYIPYELLYIYSVGATGVHGGTYSTPILYPQTPRLWQEECVLLSPSNIVLSVILSSLRFWKTATGQSHIAQKGQRTHSCGHPMSVEPRAHQVKATALSTLQRRAYDHYLELSDESNEKLEFDDWCQQKAKTCLQFDYWAPVLQLELMVLVYLRSLR